MKASKPLKMADNGFEDECSNSSEEIEMSKYYMDEWESIVEEGL